MLIKPVLGAACGMGDLVAGGRKTDWSWGGVCGESGVHLEVVGAGAEA